MASSQQKVPPGVTTRHMSRGQGHPNPQQENDNSPTAQLEQPDSDYDDAPEDSNTLQEQVQALTQDQSRTQRLLEQLLSRLPLPSNPAPRTAAPSPQNIVRSTERQTPESTILSPSTGHKYSKKLPDPQPLSDGTDPTFLGWKIQIQGKFRSNGDHFQDEEDKMFYVFNRTTGDAQKHLQPRIDEDSQTRFVSAKEMIDYLASIFVNPNQVRDAKWEYDHNCTMKKTQTFAEFHTQFLHLAGEAQIPRESLRLDLYDRLTTPLQRGIAPMLRTLDTYQELSANCMSLDTELKRIVAREERQKSYREQSATRPTRPTHPSAPALGNVTASAAPTLRRTGNSPDPMSRTTHSTPPRSTSENPRTSEARRPAPADANTVCYNCYGKGHYAATCPEPRRVDLKEMDEEEALYDSGKEEP
jgi:hypothetical protein